MPAAYSCARRVALGPGTNDVGWPRGHHIRGRRPVRCMAPADHQPRGCPCTTRCWPRPSASTPTAASGSRPTSPGRSAPVRIRAWWSSITCPATTRPPGRSPAPSRSTATPRSVRTSTTARRQAPAPTMPRQPSAPPAGSPTSGCVGDVAADHLRSLTSASGRVGVIGYCSGGRQTYVVACSMQVDAAVDCYGGRVVAATEDLSERQPVAPLDMTANLSCPLLGLFGGEDRNPSTEHVARIEEELRKHGKTHEFHVYDGAGHAFFAVDRPSYRVHAATDGWQRIWTWFGRHLT